MPKNKSPTSASYNSSGGEGDDVRKKRGNSQDEREAFKKVRSEAIPISSETVGSPPIRELGRFNYERSSSSSPPSLTNGRPDGDRVWDLESAILYLVQIGNAGYKKDKDIIHKNQDGFSGKEIARDDRKIEGEMVCKDASTLTSTTEQKQTKREETSLVGYEYLTEEETSWITFRAAHAGDASAIAQWYRKQRCESRRRRRRSKQSKPEEEEPEIEKHPLRATSSNEEDSSPRRRQNSTSSNDNTEVETNSGEDVSSSLQLEHWLAEGLGDENNCPFFHGLLAYVHRSAETITDDKDKTNGKDTKTDSMSVTSTFTAKEEEEKTISGGSHCHLAAVVLMSLSWAFGNRTLKIEWMSIDSSFHEPVLRQKVWLRIHTLSSMTACKAISVDEELLRCDATLEEEKDKEEEPLEGGKASGRKNHLVEPSAE